MIGKVIEGRYEGAHICKLPDKNLLFIETEDGERIALSKKNAISIDDITDQYPSMGRKVMMVMWNDFETSVLQFEMPPARTLHRNTNTGSISTKEKKDNPHTNSAHTPQMSNGRYCKIHLEKCVDGVFCNTCGRNLKESEILIIGCSEDDKHSKSKQSKNQMRTASDNIPSTTSVGVGTKTILLWLCIGLLFVGVFFKAKVMNTPTEEDILANRIEAFNLLHSTLTQESDLSDTEQKKMIATYAKDAGLSYQAQDPFSKTFVDEYIATYSVHAFVEKLYAIYDEEYYRWDCTEIGNEIKCEYQMLNDMLIYALEANGIELITVALPPQGSAGFYADYPEEVPESKVFEKSGKFNSGSGADIYIDTKTCTTVGSAHGDFATMREEGYSYDEGEYGWRNGVFYDTRPSWKYYDNTFYYYKGVRLGKINLSTTQYFFLGDATYFLLPPENCSRGEHGRREWLKVEVDEEALAEQTRRINIIKDAAKEEIRTLIPETLSELDMDALYVVADKSEVWDSLVTTYPKETVTDGKFSIDAVYRLKIGLEFLDVTILLTGDLNENSFEMAVIDVNVSKDEKGAAYATAETLLSEGKIIDAAMAFGSACGYSDAAERALALWDSIIKRDTICVSANEYLVILDDGTVHFKGDNKSGEGNVSSWTNIVHLSSESNYSIGVKSDGSVLQSGDRFAGDTSEWTNIVLTSAEYRHIVGLKSDGTVITAGDNYDVSQWRGIVNVITGRDYVIGITKNGEVKLAGGTNHDDVAETTRWSGIVDICSFEGGSIGLKSDGTLVATNSISNHTKKILAEWTDIVGIATGYHHIVALRSDGTVVAVGENREGQCEVDHWSNVTAVYAGGNQTAAVCSDGTRLLIGSFGL